MKNTTHNLTLLTVAGLAALPVLGAFALLTPRFGLPMIGVATVAALVGMGALDLRKRAY